jgi:hypothetical protein
MTSTFGKHSTLETRSKINPRTKFRIQGLPMAYGSNASALSGTTSGTFYVSTGLKSPVYGGATLIINVSVITANKPSSKTIKWFRASGSYAVYRLDKPATVKAGASYAAFNWYAFEE